MRHLTAIDGNSLGAALQELIPTGIFDSVESVFGDFYCTKNGNQIVQFLKSGNNWVFKTFLSATTEASGSHITEALAYTDGYICAQGLYLITGSSGGIVTHIIVTKGSNGQCVSLVGKESSSIQLTNSAPYYVTSYGDDTSLRLYSDGYRVPGSALNSSGVADRTQLLKIPICGQMGSTDYVDKCRAILLRQYSDPGVVEIDGTKYFCLNRFAIVDE